MKRLAAIILLPLLAACAAAPPTDASAVARHTFRGATMGTTYAVTVVGRGIDEPRLAGLRAAVQAALDEVDATMSHYRPDSDLSRFNRWRETAPFPVAAGLVAVVRESIAISDTTGGALDVTVAPLVDAWGFGAPGPATALPTETEIDALRRDVGYRYLEVDEASSTLRKERPGVRIDLSSIAKGHGVDRAAEALAAGGIVDYLVEVGGEVRAHGTTETGAPWQVGIEGPRPGRSAIRRVVPLGDGALATSGEYRNFYDLAGVRVSHTIDPRTGRPVTHRLRAVSVLADRCARADGLATALEVLGPDEGYALAAERGWAALFVVEEDGGALRDRLTPAFEALVRPGGRTGSSRGGGFALLRRKLLQ
ncbi:MAG: FAD:protein FMN transferase [Acidobacteria bacterium]|nr:FAD:protein FMN transferase [Acidobacteriota bacterium]